MTDVITTAFLDKCANAALTIDSIMRDPAAMLKKMNYEPPTFTAMTTDNAYGASNTTTLAAQSGSAAASMAGITPTSV
jgi:hypothetical protein